jgi:hypothetical protein
MVRRAQVPTEALALHTSHSSAQGELQHTESTQNPL